MAVSDWLDMMPHTVVAQPGAEDHTGAWSASGDPVDLTCRIEGSRELVRNAQGEEVVSSVQLYVGTVAPLLTTDGYRFTLPAARPKPRTDLEAMAIELVDDEDGPHHQVVYL